MKSVILIVSSIALLLSGCGGAEQTSKEAFSEPERTPAVFRVKFETTKGDFVVEVTRDWAPLGADRFYELVRARFYDGCRFHRVVRRFVAQFGISPNPDVSRLWSQLRIPDDPVKESNRKGTLSFAKTGPATRTTQVFINLADNDRLDGMGFAPFGKVVSGMDVVEQLYAGYGDFEPRGNAPDQARTELEGEQYLARYYSRLDMIKTARLEQ